MSRIQLLIDEEEYDTIYTLADWIDWTQISIEPRLSENFIREFAEYVDWGEISSYQRHLSDDFIREFSNYIDWEQYCRTGDVPQIIIREFPDEVYWDLISHAAPSEDLIRDFQHRVDWESISSCQPLSVPFIKEFAHKVDWECISRHQNITDELCDLFYDRLDWDEIARDRRLTYRFIKKYSQHIPKVNRIKAIIKKAEDVNHALNDSTNLPNCIITNIVEFLM